MTTSISNKPVTFHPGYNYAGGVVRALTKGDDIDSTDVPKAALDKIGDWTDTTFAYRSAFVGKDEEFVHVDDMAAGNDRNGKRMDEGFIAATAGGKVVATGSFNTDNKGNVVASSVVFDKKPWGV